MASYKWGIIAKSYLRIAEFCAVKFSNYVISDSEVISKYIKDSYNVDPNTITYGGDTFKDPIIIRDDGYALCLCRIEPENNIHIILESFFVTKYKLIFVGNWDASKYGKDLKDCYNMKSNIHCINPIYDQSEIQRLRSNCSFYIHGHSAGGTNPSLVEMMFYGKESYI